MDINSDDNPYDDGYNDLDEIMDDYDSNDSNSNNDFFKLQTTRRNCFRLFHQTIF